MWVTVSKVFLVAASLDLSDIGPATDPGISGIAGNYGEAGNRTGGRDGVWDGLYSLPQCSQSTLLALPHLDRDAYQAIEPLG